MGSPQPGMSLATKPVAHNVTSPNGTRRRRKSFVFISIRRNNGLKLHLVEIMKQLLALYSWFKESYERNVCPCCQKKAAKLAPKTRFPAHFGSSLFSVE